MVMNSNIEPISEPKQLAVILHKGEELFSFKLVTLVYDV